MTTFPTPVEDDDEPHVYVSVGHQQMMTDPMKPLGISVWQLTSKAPMRHAGGRLFVDVTAQLASAAGQRILLEVTVGRSDPLVADALRSVIDTGFVPVVPDAEPPPSMFAGPATPVPTDAALVADLVARIDASVEEVAHRLAAARGIERFDLIRDDEMFDPGLLPVLMAGIEAVWWLNERLEEWLGSKGAADALIQSAPGDVTAEMALALLDVADAMRPSADVVAFLREPPVEGFLDGLEHREGGPAARAALEAWLDRFGVRGVGEIDITRPRWRERPDLLAAVLVGHIDNFEAGEAARRHQRGLDAARRRREEVLAQLRALPDGEAKAVEVDAMIERARTFIGFREHPKFGMVRRYAFYKEALLDEARGLVSRGVLPTAEDAFFLTFDELREAVASGRADLDAIRRRAAELESFQHLTPPRVLTSDGRGYGGAYRRDGGPEGALVGLGVSAGVVEGRARVVLDLWDADLEPGDILVTRFTDPSWTPVFVTIAGLVTEVGGLMTHGAVVARECGLPAVVGVEQATQRIPDGRRIRIDGAGGWVELLD